MPYYLPKLLHNLCERLHVERAEKEKKKTTKPPVNFFIYQNRQK